MKRLEGIIIKLVIIQFLFLAAAQFVNLYTDISPYLSKVIEYEGVSDMDQGKRLKQ